MAGWFTTIERRKEKKKTHHVSPLPVEKAIATSKCECVCVREEEEEEIYIYRERETREEETLIVFTEKKFIVHVS